MICLSLGVNPPNVAHTFFQRENVITIFYDKLASPHQGSFWFLDDKIQQNLRQDPIALVRAGK